LRELSSQSFAQEGRFKQAWASTGHNATLSNR